MNNTIETEQQYLGCLMLMGFREMNPHDISSACNGLQPDDFMTPQNRAIFNSIKNRSDRGQSFENILIIEETRLLIPTFSRYLRMQCQRLTCLSTNVSLNRTR